MKSQVNLLSALISDELGLFGYSPRRDIATLESRVAHEGLAFMTITLPRLDDLLLAGLRDGALPPVEGWRTQGALPLFLGKLWQRIFDSDGTLVADPCPAAIRSIRQISIFAKKYKDVCSNELVDAEIGKFVHLERNYPVADIGRLRELPRILRIAFGESIAKIHKGYVSDVAWLKAKHGPGAVAERANPVERWEFPSIPPRTLSTFGSELFNPLWDVNFNPDDSAIPARLVAVPKTATKPRLICAEPAYNQFVQQGMQAVLKGELHRRKLICDYTDQSRNQHLSRVGSVDGSLATIDLSEASDRVGWALVRHAFSFDQLFLKLLRDSRSEFVDIGDGNVICQKKFAPMGSAMTFPIQCMLFTGIVTLAACELAGDFSPKYIRRVITSKSDYTVYGDDIIVPTDLYPRVVDLLTSAGLKVNDKKTFNKGFFRESCGTDWFKGVNVTPVYLRYPLDSNSDVNRILSLVSTRNQLRTRVGDGKSIGVLDEYLISLDRRIRHARVPDEFPLDSGLHSCNVNSRYNRGLQSMAYRVLSPRYTHEVPTGTPRQLMSYYLSKVSGGGASSTDGIGRPKASKLNLGWRTQ